MIQQLDYRGSLADAAAVTERLIAAGLSVGPARSKARLFAKAAEALGRRSDRPPRAYFVPGRIEVFGKHTDYAGGASMLVAAEQGFCLAVAPRDDRQVRVLDVGRDEEVEFALDADLTPALGHWSNYPMTVARRVARNFPGADCGAEVIFASDLPPAAGMSSSSAMIVATFLAMADVNRLYGRAEFQQNVHDLPDLAGYLATVENGQTFGSLAGDRGVGTLGGSEDHTAILNCRADWLSEFAYCPVRLVRSVPMPAGYTFVVGSSGVVAEKTGAARELYNRASGLAARVAEIWREQTGRDDPHLAAALASGPEAAGLLIDVVRAGAGDLDEADALLGRMEHFVTENEQLRPQQGDALARGDLDALGSLVDRSQNLAEELLGNQVPQTIRLAALARAYGATAALAFGAGFGGSVWALVESARAGEFLSGWSESYAKEFPEQAAGSQFFRTGAGPAAFALGDDQVSRRITVS